MSGADLRPDRQALLELDALLGEIVAVRDEGDGDRFDRDRRYRWFLHWLWIAIGNEALAYTAAIGRPFGVLSPGRTAMSCATISRTTASSTSTTDESGESPG